MASTSLPQPEVIMARSIEVLVEVVGQHVAKVWRKPDDECPAGRSYAVKLNRIINADADRDKVEEGDVLSARLDARGEVDLARFLRHDPSGAPLRYSHT